jgi:hypothetical protein
VNILIDEQARVKPPRHAEKQEAQEYPANYHLLHGRILTASGRGKFVSEEAYLPRNVR